MTEGFERYPHRSITGFPTRSASLAGLFVLLLGALAVHANVRDGEVFVAWAAGYFMFMLGIGGIGIGLTGRPAKAQFRFINAVVMTRAERAPIDSWVHVAPTRPLPWPLLICNAMFALGMVFAFVMGILQLTGAIPQVNADTTPIAFGAALLLVLALGAISGFLAYVNFARKWRSGRFGARPSGVALGARSVAVRVPGVDAEILWGHIRSVEPRIMPSKRRDLTMIALDLDPGAGITGHVQMLSADGYTVPTDALYTALRWYHLHPEHRWELGRVEGQRRIEGWRIDALAASRPQR